MYGMRTHFPQALHCGPLWVVRACIDSMCLISADLDAAMCPHDVHRVPVAACAASCAT